MKASLKLLCDPGRPEEQPPPGGWSLGSAWGRAQERDASGTSRSLNPTPFHLTRKTRRKRGSNAEHSH